ncbi:hypothetical protein [uncultured Methanocorpusculum sp.]|nr:hypothetical protein [uncultured Methanocorpusculum sp.]
MNLDLFKYILALLIFGSNGIVASFIALTSYEIVFFRTMIGALFLILLCISKASRRIGTGWGLTGASRFQSGKSGLDSARRVFSR